MAVYLSYALFCASCLSLGLVAAQSWVLRRHLRGPLVRARRKPPISVLKPLCGLDDGLEANLATFASLDYPEYEVVLGVRSARDPAWQTARAVARRWPSRFRVVIQRGEPGLNPKVNQLVTLARASRHDVLVVSDSNVRVDACYLDEIAALLDDDRVGLVTHLIAGEGERSLGSALDHLHLTASIAPSVLGLKRLAGRDVVVGKSMALRRADLLALGGFEAAKDVLAEDYVLGAMIGEKLGKRIEIGRRPVRNVSARRTVVEFVGRYRRWSVLQRQAAGPLVYACGAFLNPVLLAVLATALSRSTPAFCALAGACAMKTALDAASAGELRPGGFRVGQLALIPMKDVVLGVVWAFCFVRRDVAWRGTRIVVGRGTRIRSTEPDASPSPTPRRAASAAAPAQL